MAQPIETLTAAQAAVARTGLRIASPYAAGVRRLFDLQNNPITIAVLGDSTGNNDVDWTMRALLKPNGLIERFPSHGFRTLLWSDTLQAYLTPVIRSYGTDGPRCFELDGTTQYIWAADEAKWDMLSNQTHTVRVWIDPADAGSGERVLAAKFGGAGNRSWRFEINAGGSLYADWSEDGTVIMPGHTGPNMSTFAPVAGWYWLQWRLTATTGDSSFWTSPDGINWSSLGANVAAGATSVFNSNAAVTLGARSIAGGGSPNSFFKGKIAEYWAHAGVGGAAVFTSGWTAGAAYQGFTTSRGFGNEVFTHGGTPTLSGAQEVTLFNGSHPGAAISYSSDDTRFPKQVPLIADLAIINYGHNESSTAAAYVTAIAGLVTRLRAVNVSMIIAACLQNPQKPAATNYLAHERRIQGLSQYCDIANLAAVDAYSAIAEYAAWQTELMTDNVHPNLAGSDVWADTFIQRLGL